MLAPDRKRIEDYSKILPVCEIYACVQAEGSRAGYPTIAIRTLGCTHRCFFGEGGWCDTPYASINPEEGKHTFQDIIDIYEKYPHIKDMMLTGGSPTMHPALVNELTHFAEQKDIFITMETEGSHYVETDYPIDLLSISPKFSNSIPKIGVEAPGGYTVDEKFVKIHNMFRLNKPAIRKMIEFHADYQIKPVWDGMDMNVLEEILHFIDELNIPDEKVWFMPAGDSLEALLESYPKVMNFVRDAGFRFTGRPHIVAFGKKRGY